MAYEPHPTVGKYSAKRGHLMGMFRDPDQRILSGFHDDVNNLAAIDYAEFLREGFGVRSCTYFGQEVPKRHILDFAESWKGGMTYQILVEQPATQTLDPNRTRMTREDAAEAARRVREGFSFVGITEEWELSVCLFHRMFGGACHAAEFVDTRPSFAGKTAHRDYDPSELLDWHDDVDAVVYATALDIFRARLLSFNVSQEACQECYNNASRPNLFQMTQAHF